MNHKNSLSVYALIHTRIYIHICMHICQNIHMSIIIYVYIYIYIQVAGRNITQWAITLLQAQVIDSYWLKVYNTVETFVVQGQVNTSQKLLQYQSSQSQGHATSFGVVAGDKQSSIQLGCRHGSSPTEKQRFHINSERLRAFQRLRAIQKSRSTADCQTADRACEPQR